jgi:DNA helicase II / ATP-dependent DNA helicase PcrA
MQDSQRQLQKQFDKLLGTLNPQQRIAVDSIEGPALVIAGPGTGKTHLVATRIANILLQTDTPPQSILCLTYSEAGSAAMRKRLVQIIGADAYKITVSTYHSFCSRVMQEHPELFGRGRDMELISDLERSEWMDELMSTLPSTHLYMRRYKGLSNVKTKLIHLFGSMKREKWAVDWMLSQITAYEAEMPANPDFLYKKAYKTFKKGDIRTGIYEEWLDKLTLLKAGVALYDQWQKLLSDRNRYEFDDMVAWVIDAITKHKHLKLQLQERYLYLVIDEYQDTNAAQNQLIKLMSDYWEAPNIFIVGDDDQSIYEFQGARLYNLVEFHQTYADTAEVVVLEQNYRSSQAILDAAKQVIEHNKIRALPLLGLGNTKHLHSNQKWTEAPEIHAFDDELSEMTWITERIQQGLAEGVEPHEIAVIFRTNKEGERIGVLLREQGIGFTIKKDVNVLDLPLIKHLTEVMAWCVDELHAPLEGDAQLFYLLHQPYWGLKPLDLAILLAKRRNTDHAQPLRLVLNDAAFVRSAGVQQPDLIVEVMQKLEQLIASTATMPLLRFWTELLNATGALRWCINQTESVYWTQAIHTFTMFLEGEVKRLPNLNIRQVPSLLRNMSQLKLRIALIQTAQAAQGIQLVTAHGAKGLEFEMVFVYNCTKQVWQDQGDNQRGKFTLPPNITLSGEEDGLEAQRRLFYVAMTRAKRWLYMSYAKRDANLKDQAPVQFLEETQLPIIEHQLEPEEIAHRQIVLLTDAEPIKAEVVPSQLIQASMETYQLSLSGLNQYLRCPLAFYYEKILKLPDVSSDAALFGSYMHSALEYFFQKRNAARLPESVDLATLKQLFRAEITRHQHRFSSTTDFRNKLEYGLQCLEQYHAKHQNSWPAKTKLETRIDKVTIGEVPVTGVIDRIDLLPNNQLRIVDYKTGKYSAAKFSQPNEKLPYGSDYYRQGLFYKLLADANPYLNGTVNEVIFSYLEPDKDKKYQEYRIDLDRGDLDWMRELIKTTWTKIKKEEFETGCGAPDCVYCNLHRTGVLDADRLDDVHALDDE